MIWDEIMKAVGYLFIAGICAVAYYFANSAKMTRNKILFQGLLWCIGIALFGAVMLGSPTCEEQDDPIRGGCAEYADDGFESSTEMRIVKFAYYMILLYVPVAFAAFNKRD